MDSSSCGTSTSGAGPSACFELEEGELEEKSNEKEMISRMVTPGMNVVDAVHPPIEGQDTSIILVANKFSDSSIEASESQGIDALGRLSSSSCLRLTEGECKDDETSPKRMLATDKCERDNVQPVIYQLATGIIFPAESIPGINGELTDRQITGGALGCEGAIMPSACFELEEAEMYVHGKEKPGSRKLFPKTEDDLNSLHPVNDSRDTRFKVTDKRLPDTYVAAFDRKIVGMTDVEDQMKFPFQQTFHAEPMVSHIWSGSFKISKVEFGNLRAHLSSRACEKVCNIARNLPSVLHMQKLPRLVAWPNSFKISSPTDDNVALYFSPEAVRVEAVLDELVDDLINYDLMLKFQFDGVELLVFSSFVLPQDHQRIHGKYYAWGVFKPQSAQICNVQAASNGVAKGYQVENPLNFARRIEVKNHIDVLLKDSAQGVDFVSSQSSIQPKEESITKSTSELKEVAEERIERADMASSSGRSKDSRGDSEHHSVPTRPHNMTKFAEAKRDSTALSNLSKVHRPEGEILDSGNFPSNQTAKFEKLGEQMVGYEIQKKLETLADIEEGEVCDDEWVNDSKCGGSPSLELFPLHVENMGIAFRFRAIKGDNDLKLGLGLPPSCG